MQSLDAMEEMKLVEPSRGLSLAITEAETALWRLSTCAPVPTADIELRPAGKVCGPDCKCKTPREAVTES